MASNASMPEPDTLPEAVRSARESERHILEASNKGEAFAALVSACELYMNAASRSQTKSERLYLRAYAQALLELATRLKEDANFDIQEDGFGKAHLRRMLEQIHWIASIRPTAVPESQRKQTTTEKLLILQASKLNGFIFPPWKGDEQELAIPPGSDLFADSPDLQLSSQQQRLFDGWKRVPHLFQSDDVSSSTVRTNDLIQDITTDCSVVASLCAISARFERGFPTLIVSSVTKDAKQLHIPKDGKVTVKLYFNGSYRKVVTDDRLPASRTARSLFVVDKNNPGAAWPALIEKAYLKVRGGYDFPGSNSGTDLWILTGWIPEQIRLKEDTTSNALWDRIYAPHHEGKLLITLGTGKMSSQEEKEQGLVSEHSYAVIDMLSDPKLGKMVLIKNPWSKGPLLTPTGQEVEPNNGILGSFATGLLETLTEIKPAGLFWISFENLIRHFESIFLNWDPCIFSRVEDIHFSWKISPELRCPDALEDRPQFILVANGTVWLLLSRHFKTGDASADAVRAGTEQNYIGLSVYDNRGRRVYLSSAPAIAVGDLISAPQTLLQVELPDTGRYTVVVSQDALGPGEYSFTLQAYSNTPVELVPATSRYSITSLHNSAWLPESAGGDANSPLYYTNPQFALTLSSKTPLLLFLESEEQDVLLHIHLVYAGGKHVQRLTMRNMAATSGSYRRGCAMIELENIDAGSYTVVCSTFTSGQLSNFKLKVGTSVPHQLSQLASENAGLLTTPLNASFPEGITRLVCPLRPSRLTAVIFRIRPLAISHVPSATSSTLRASLVVGLNPITSQTLVATSAEGAFLDAPPSGLVSEKVDISPDMAARGGAWLVLERATTGVLVPRQHEDIEVKLLTEYRLDIGPWREERL